MNQVSDFITDHVSDVLPDMPQMPVTPVQTDVTVYPPADDPDQTPVQVAHDTDKTEETTDQKLDVEKIKSQLYTMKDEIDSILRQLDGSDTTISVASNTAHITNDPKADTQTTSAGDKIIEGVFNGEKMIGSDGNEYAVPPNYASKSKLVEGDIMKLTLTPTGRFIYKQIGPIPRKRIIGELVFDTEKQLWYVRVDGKDYKILTASVTFYKGKPGDEAIILVSEADDSTWGAVDNIMSK